MSKENDLNIDDITLGNLNNPESALFTSTGEDIEVQEKKEQPENKKEITEQPEVEESTETTQTTETVEDTQEEETPQFNVDDDGNLINEKGEVVYKKVILKLFKMKTALKKLKLMHPKIQLF